MVTKNVKGHSLGKHAINIVLEVISFSLSCTDWFFPWTFVSSASHGRDNGWKAQRLWCGCVQYDTEFFL